MKVALKKLNGSQNISAEYLSELKVYWDICLNYKTYLTFYGMTKDPETKEFIIIMDFANEGNLRNTVLHNFKNISWNYKINWLFDLATREEENFGYTGKEIKTIFEEADKEIPNITTSYEKDPDAIYTSREFIFSKLSRPVNSSIISSYLQEEKVDEVVNTQDSQLVNLDVKRFL
ncbi:uncharacterized protein OCT59_018982 [Rhizophagus irregularis]|uniref:uncharacterized protein n=1 Tax=Rhizophagus irregularis TaxID=588596 RepID=UPI0033227FC1|nr:hypothetical protein OCT59_018982 [Rhizophagus irregularis]